MRAKLVLTEKRRKREKHGKMWKNRIKKEGKKEEKEEEEKTETESGNERDARASGRIQAHQATAGKLAPEANERMEVLFAPPCRRSFFTTTSIYLLK